MNYLDLPPEYVARVTSILTRPMTAIEFADLFWPERVKKRKTSQRSQGGHALLNTLVRQGLVRRKKNKNGTPDTFVLRRSFDGRLQDAISRVKPLTPERIAAARAASTEQEIGGDLDEPVNDRCYWVLLWREKDDWGWLRSLNGNDDCTTEEPGKRLRYTTREAAMVALWKFRRDNDKRPGETLTLVRVTISHRASGR